MSAEPRPHFSPPDRTPDELVGLRVLVFGLGGFGGGAGVARFLAERGAAVTITDLRPPEQLAPSLELLADVPLAGTRLGGHDIRDFQETDWVVVNPAVPPGNVLIAQAERAGARLVTEIGMFLSWCPTPFVAGVTGSNGKSTTCQLLADLLEASGYTTHLGGNFGGSLLGALPGMTAEDRVVLELSSFQLSRLGPGTPRPAAVGITQIAANHLDWHGTFEAYRAAKEELLIAPRPDLDPALQIAALPRKDPQLIATARRAGRRVVACGAETPRGTGIGVIGRQLCEVTESETQRVENLPTALASLDRLPRPGVHEIENAATACALAIALGADRTVFEETIARQKPLPHRQEEVAEVRGVRFIDDSKSTTPEATRAALDAYAPRAVLLAGGHHKGGDLSALAEAVREGASGAICYGESREELARALRDGGVDPEKIEVVDRFAQAFRRATERAREGDVVLLSPACASFDEFRNYEERAERFRALIDEWQNL